MKATASPPDQFDSDHDTSLFEAITHNIQQKGYGIHPNALPNAIATALWLQVQNMPPDKFQEAGIGREVNHTLNNFVRTDQICWITGKTVAGQSWLDWAQALQNHLNRHLFLGLFSFESHFAHYAPGDFYKKHVDAFKGETNRVLSIIVYLNPDWTADDGGELVIYTDPLRTTAVKVTPGFGTIVTFLSEDFPHEVLTARRDRYSIAGWFRVNTSNYERVDPPR